MNPVASGRNPSRFRSSAAAVTLFFVAAVAGAQDSDEFDPFAADAELTELRTSIEQIDADTDLLTATRARAAQIASAAAACAALWAEERPRLQSRLDRLSEAFTNDVPTAVFDQRAEVQRLVEQAVAQETACAGAAEDATALIARVAEIQTLRSQQVLSFRGSSIISVIRDLPDRIRTWPREVREANRLTLVAGVDPIRLFWLLIGAGVAAAGIGVFLRQRFVRWFSAAGGADAAPQLRFLIPKPIAEYAPSLLSGIAFIGVLYATIEAPSLELAVIRIALGILLFGIGCVVIDWATGPLSPSAGIKGLIPDHIGPIRLRLRVLILSLIASFVLLGTSWLAVRMIGQDVTGRAAMIFVVACALLYVILYLGRIPGLRYRFRLIRTLATVGLVVGIVAVLFGYQNFAGYLVHGIVRSALALFILWILVWLVSVSFNYVSDEETDTAANLRRALGAQKGGSRPGLGFMQLIADLVLWLSLLVYLIYVWDEAGTTLDRLIEIAVNGGTVGNLQLVPVEIISGILVFAGMLILIGWIKRWIDRRWLQHIVMERGAREALITLFGYAAFVIALLIGLFQAGVDLSGLAIVSGALALGIGFGLQEIANNFVSGLILLFERPIRSGDFVTVGEIEGFVRKISIRATEIETLDNQNVLVPNSELVSGRVTNWVLRDSQGRLRINVGVAYGSDVDAVRDILEQVSREHPEVITDSRAPAPRALFMGFGDSSLDFELRCRINRIDRRFTVTSDINFALDAAFREAGISIPFPQRDLHIVSQPDRQVASAVPEQEPAPTETQRLRTLPTPDRATRHHRQEIEIATDIGDVWHALTDPESIAKWLGARSEFDAFIGGRYEFSFPDGSIQKGRIDVFIPPQRMRLVDAPREGEEPLPTGPITTLIILRDEDSKTRLSVTVSGIPNSEDWQEDFNRSQALWQNAFVELSERLASE